MDDTPAQGPTGTSGKAEYRLEATVTPGPGKRSLDEVADLDLDRIPARDGGVRVLVTPDQAGELVKRGFEVRLVRALAVEPLDRALVVEDETAQAWLEERVKGVARTEGS